MPECKKWKFDMLASTREGASRKYRTYASLKREGYKSDKGTSVIYLCGKRRAWATKCPTSCEWDCIGSAAMMTRCDRFNCFFIRIDLHRLWRLQPYNLLRRLGAYGYQWNWCDTAIFAARRRRIQKVSVSTTWLQNQQHRSTIDYEFTCHVLTILLIILGECQTKSSS